MTWLQENERIDPSGNLTCALDMSTTFGTADVIGSRVDRQTDKVRECVHQAFVLGMKFDVTVLSQMLNQEPEPQLEDGARNRIWEVLREVKCIFSHIPIRDVVYQRMMSDRLKDMHRIVAEEMIRFINPTQKGMRPGLPLTASRPGTGKGRLNTTGKRAGMNGRRSSSNLLSGSCKKR